MFYHDACINLLPLCVYKVLDPTKRLGCDEMGGYSLLKADPFYEGVNWENLSKETPPRLLPYLPATCADGPEFWGDSEVIF